MTVGWGSGWWGAISRPLTLAACLLVLAACGGDDSDEGDRTPVATPGPTTAPEPTQAPDPLGFSDVTWATEVDQETREPQDEVTTYPNTAPAIIAVIHVDELPAGTELTAVWTIDGTEVPDAQMAVATDETVVDAWVTFQFTRDQGTRFPLGVLEVEITGSEGTSVTGEVEIVLPGN